MHKYILKAIRNTGAAAAASNNGSIKVMLKKYAPLTDGISEISNKQVDNAKDIDVVMPKYNLVKFKIIWKFVVIAQVDQL